MIEELWRFIPETEENYRASTLGNIYSMPRPHAKGDLLSLGTITWGYKRVKLHINGRSTSKLVHRLVAMTFLPNPLNLPEVNHKNGDKLDNRMENLEWVTQQQNCRHAFDTGLNVAVRGQEHPKCSMSDELVLEIAYSKDSNEVLSKKYRIPKGTISKIKTGGTWRHLTGIVHKKKWNILSKDAISDIKKSPERIYILAKRYNVSWAAINQIRKKN